VALTDFSIKGVGPVSLICQIWGLFEKAPSEEVFRG
jgi:hypothetical protein